MGKQNLPKIDENSVMEVIKKEFKNLTLKEIFQYHTGWVHKKYRISFLEKYDKVVLRFGAEKENVHFEDDHTADKEIYVADLISKKTDVKVPAILSRGEYRGLEYLIMEDLDGPNLEEAGKVYNDQTILKIMCQWGGVMAQIHNSLKATNFGYIEAKGIVKPFNLWSDMFKSYTSIKLDSEIIPLELREASKGYIERKIKTLDLERDPTLILYDINSMNIIVRDGNLRGLIDFDLALYGHKSLDFMFPFLDRSIGNVKTKEPYVKGYLEGGGKLPHHLDELNKLNTLNFLMSTIINYHGAGGHRSTWSADYTEKLRQFLKENA